MKKTYFAPEAVVIELKQNACLLSASDPVVDGGGGGIADAPILPGGDIFGDPTWNVLLGE